MKNISAPFVALFIFSGVIYLIIALILPPASPSTEVSMTDLSSELPSPAPDRLLASPLGACTAFCLDSNDACVFGANQDNTLDIGLLFVNKRGVQKTTWDPSTSGEYARWTSRYGSVTVNFVGYQMAWAGMNEAGLMISTMSVAGAQGPTSDERPPFQTPLWMQYQLDTHRSVEQVIASEAELRPVPSAVDHYLVCDRAGACATIEFLEGTSVYHTGESLPVKALTNHPYQDSIVAWKESLSEGSQPEDNSLWRFTTVANRLEMFKPSSPDEAVAYAFDTLAAASRQDTVWSFVFDPVNLRAYFRTNHNPNIRYVDFSSLDFSCRTSVKLLDVHADVSGDISEKLTAYTHADSLAHSTRFFTEYEGMSMSPLLVDTLLWGLESFPCRDDDLSTQTDLVRYRPLLPPTATWAGLMLLHRVGPFWIPLMLLSLVVVIWRMMLGQPLPLSRRLAWALATVVLGPLGLLAYLLIQRKKHQAAEVSP